MKLSSDERGMTLLEVLVALAILVVAILALVGLFTTGYAGVSIAGERSEVLYQGQMELENSALNSGGENPDTLNFNFDGFAVNVPGKLIEYEESYGENRKVSLVLFIPTH